MEVSSKFYIMKTFNVTITSRNKNSIYNFFSFCSKTTLCNLNARIRYLQKNVNKKRLSVLKSPHVNKKAQEQFEYRVFKKQFTINATKTFRYLVFVKKLNYNLFPDIYIKLKYLTKNKGISKFGLKIFDPNFCKLSTFYNCTRSFFRRRSWRTVKLKKTFKISFFKLKKVRLLKLLDLYGECIKGPFE